MCVNKINYCVNIHTQIQWFLLYCTTNSFFNVSLLICNNFWECKFYISTLFLLTNKIAVHTNKQLLRTAKRTFNLIQKKLIILL